LAVVLLIDLLKAQCLGKKIQNFLIVLLLVLEFALAVDVAIVASQASISMDYEHLNHHLAEHRDWSIAAAFFAWIFKVPLLLVFTFLALGDSSSSYDDSPAPPPTADRM
jgi:hypothetical protein